MTVTGVRVAMDEGTDAKKRKVAEALRAAGIGDSKALCAHGAMGSVERVVLSMLDVHLGVQPASLDALTERFGLENATALKLPCPSGEASQVCFGQDIALPAFGGSITDASRREAAALDKLGFSLRDVRISVRCAGVLNDARAIGQSRFDVDLASMCALLAVLAEGHAPVRAVLGKVGARSKYTEILAQRFALVRTDEERREVSRYNIAALGTVHFVMDGDASEPTISLASMFGKYARELWMRRHNQYWQQAVEGLHPVSGYHDPVTDRLVRATALVRKTRAIPQRCFER